MGRESPSVCAGHEPTGRVSQRSMTSLHWLPLWADADLAPWPGDQRIRCASNAAGDPMRLSFSILETWALDIVSMSFWTQLVVWPIADRRWVFQRGGKRRTGARSLCSGASRGHGSSCSIMYPIPSCVLICAPPDVHLASMDSAWNGLMCPASCKPALPLAARSFMSVDATVKLQHGSRNPAAVGLSRKRC